LIPIATFRRETVLSPGGGTIMPWRFLWIMLAVLLFPAGAAQAQVLAARVNGQPITLQQVEGSFNEMLTERGLHLLQIRNPDRVKAMKHSVLDELVNQELLGQAAKKTKLAASDEEVDEALERFRAGFRDQQHYRLALEKEGYTEQDYRELVRRRLSGMKYANSVAAKAPEVSAEEIHKFYDENPGKFYRPEQVRVRVILVAVPADATPEQRAEARARMDGIAAAARSGEDFAVLARTHSDHPTKQWDGELDPFARGEADKALEETAFALNPGEISGVMEVPAGYQIVKLEAHLPEVRVSEDQARDKIREFLQAQKGKEAVDREVERLRKQATVEILLPQ